MVSISFPSQAASTAAMIWISPLEEELKSGFMRFEEPGEDDRSRVSVYELGSEPCEQGELVCERWCTAVAGGKKDAEEYQVTCYFYRRKIEKHVLVPIYIKYLGGTYFSRVAASNDGKVVGGLHCLASTSIDSSRGTPTMLFLNLELWHLNF